MIIKDFFNSVMGRGSRHSKYYASYIFGGKNTEWISTNGNELKYYYSIPELALVVNRRASMKANAKIKHYKNGKEVENSEVVEYLNHPNVLQSRNEFLMQRDIQRCLFGNAFTYILTGNRDNLKMGVNPSAMWNLPPSLLEINRTGKMFEQVDVDEIVSNLKMQTGGETTYFDYKDVWHSNDPNPEDPLLGASKLTALEKPLSNICLSYAYRNTVMLKKGALGILSPDIKGEMGSMGINATERQRIEREYQKNYSSVDQSKAQVLIAETAMKWQHMSLPMKDMLLHEEVLEDFKVIVDTYGLNLYIFSQVKGATFSNVYEGIKMAYQDTIIPEGKDDAQALTRKMGMDGKNEWLEYDYSHIPVLAEDGSEKADTLKKKAEACDKLIQTGMYNSEELKKIFPLDELEQYL